MNIHTLWCKLTAWFLGKAPTKLETFEADRIEGKTVTLIRYRRRTVRSFRTWRAVYKSLEYDLIFGWSTLQYLPDVPNIPKRNRLSTHTVHVYRQGLHARFNAQKGIHEPDVMKLLEAEVCLEGTYMSSVLSGWREKSQLWARPIYELEDIYIYMADQVAMYALRHPPPDTEPLEINWREVIRQTVAIVLAQPQHVVFLPPRDGKSTGGDYWRG